MNKIALQIWSETEPIRCLTLELHPKKKFWETDMMVANKWHRFKANLFWWITISFSWIK